MIGVLAADYVARIPTMLSFDATPINYDELASWYGHEVQTGPLERAKLAVHRAVVLQEELIPQTYET